MRRRFLWKLAMTSRSPILLLRFTMILVLWSFPNYQRIIWYGFSCTRSSMTSTSWNICTWLSLFNKCLLTYDISDFDRWNFVKRENFQSLPLGVHCPKPEQWMFAIPKWLIKTSLKMFFSIFENQAHVSALKTANDSKPHKKTQFICHI